jgi:hypothetical protein
MLDKKNKKYLPGADPGFKVRRGGLEKIAPNGGRRENVGVFRVKNVMPTNLLVFQF